MRVVTFNLWHGMAPRDGWRFEALEPSFRRTKRFELQNQLLKSLEADLIFLQEVNPILERSQDLAERLRLKSFLKPDISGIRVSKLGWPYNLQSGLVTLVNENLRPRQLEAIQLSGPRYSFTSTWASWQLAECRFALPIEFITNITNVGQRVLAVNFHLHHRLEFTEELDKALHQLVDSGSMTGAAVSDLKLRLAEGDQRREVEWQTFWQWLKPRSHLFDLILLGGDLNFTEKGPVYSLVEAAGFVDLGLKSDPSGSMATFDHTRNEANHFFTRQFPLGYEFEDLSFSPKVREQLKNLLMSHEGRPRRIDYLWAGGPLAANLRCQVQQVGVPETQSDLAPSDHFGLMANLETSF